MGYVEITLAQWTAIITLCNSMPNTSLVSTGNCVCVPTPQIIVLSKDGYVSLSDLPGDADIIEVENGWRGYWSFRGPDSPVEELSLPPPNTPAVIDVGTIIPIPAWVGAEKGDVWRFSHERTRANYDEIVKRWVKSVTGRDYLVQVVSTVEPDDVGSLTGLYKVSRIYILPSSLPGITGNQDLTDPNAPPPPKLPKILTDQREYDTIAKMLTSSQSALLEQVEAFTSEETVEVTYDGETYNIHLVEPVELPPPTPETYDFSSDNYLYG